MEIKYESNSSTRPGHFDSNAIVSRTLPTGVAHVCGKLGSQLLCTY